MDNLITLNEALNRIEHTVKKYAASPYFFIIGAGVSFPPVKLAREIIKDCKEVVKNAGYYSERNFDSDMEAYSYWFKTAFDNPAERRDYIRGLIEENYISDANVWLAHFLIQTDVAKLVVTPNFDDFLSRALFLFRQPHSISDHSATTKRIELRNPDSPQIIHVHSSYRFYDTQNLINELTATTQTPVAELLAEILREQVPLIVGYSGWSKDVIMTALRKRFHQEHSPYNFYWFCYDEAALDALLREEWLRVNDFVRFVAPTEIVKKRGGVMSQSECHQAEAEKQTGEKLSDTTKTVGAVVSHTLPATEVFLKFIEKFITDKEKQTPELFRDPLDYFLKMLEKSFPPTKENENSELRIRLKDSMDKIENAILRERSEHEKQNRKLEKRSQSKQTTSTAADLENAKQMFIKSEFRSFVRLAGELKLSKFSVEQLSDLFERVGNSCERLSIAGDVEGELAGYDLMLKIYDRLGKIVPDSQTELKHEAIARALISKGAILDKLKRYDEAVKVYEEVERRFASMLGLQPLVAMAMVNKGVGLHRLGKYDEAIKAYQKFEQRFSDSESDARLLEQIARAMVNKGVAFNTQNKHAEAIEIFRKVEERFSDAVNQPRLQELVAKAMINRAHSFYETNQIDKAMEVSKTIEQKFATSTVPEMRRQVSIAISNQGFSLLCLAKKAMSEKDPSSANLLKQARDTVARALEINPKNAFAIGNQGYISFLLDDKVRAHELLSQAIQIGGEEIRQIELKDATIHPLPQDAKFCELVNSIPLLKPAA
jgi:tetratricopeptide (TPR) repeat protein